MTSHFIYLDLDFKLTEVTKIFDIIKTMSWGAIPLWFSLTVPVIYIAYKKLLPDPPPGIPAPSQSIWQQIRQFFSLPLIDEIVIYSSILLFIIGTITTYIDQQGREKSRNNGLRIKAYLQARNFYSMSKADIAAHINHLSPAEIDKVLKNFPSDFLEVDSQTVLYTDSAKVLGIMRNSEKFLDNYLSWREDSSPLRLDSLFTINSFFTREVAYRLLTDSSHKYKFRTINGDAAISR